MCLCVYVYEICVFHWLNHEDVVRISLRLVVNCSPCWLGEKLIRTEKTGDFTKKRILYNVEKVLAFAWG